MNNCSVLKQNSLQSKKLKIIMKKYTIAVVGALGNVGTEIRNILEKSELPIGKIVLIMRRKGKNNEPKQHLVEHKFFGEWRKDENGKKFQPWTG